MRTVVLVGEDAADLGGALETAEVTVHRAPVGNRPGLESAGIHDADVLVLTDLDQATAVPVATDLNPDLWIVVYTEGSLPDFISRLTDLFVDPNLLDAEAVADEIARRGE